MGGDYTKNALIFLNEVSNREFNRNVFADCYTFINININFKGSYRLQAQRESRNISGLHTCRYM